jgi:hypothetical protein
VVGGDGGGDLQGEDGSACTMITVEQGEAAKGQAILPKPASELGTEVMAGLCVDGKAARELIDGGFVLGEEGLRLGKKRFFGWLCFWEESWKEVGIGALLEIGEEFRSGG